MTKFLLAVVLIVTGVKVISNSDGLAFKNNFSNLVVEDEEEKKEKGDQGKSKYDNEDKLCPRSMSGLLISGTSTSLKPVMPEDAYVAFVDRPNTPPPNIV
jgi:hypothetical protein